MEQKNRTLAIVLALFLGGFGIHRFYLGRNGSGILYLLFFWTLIPAVLAFIDAIRYALMSETEFQRRYSGAAIPAAAPAMNPTEELERLAALKEKGHITDEEYQAKKAQLLK